MSQFLDYAPHHFYYTTKNINFSEDEDEAWRSDLPGTDIHQYDDEQCGILDNGDELQQNVVFVQKNEGEGESL